ncbi:hypothetical protein [Spirosoma montaniterrae]|uniref:Potassium transporter TrkH n=1 Tax=Spirosoma montaniterrae TaxID=1178516 RepID=A0A1P9WUI4_9BACT|nr:hypothetical protein [Spirosoma montaniterrae]AQG79044.1 hypothetical protein AWR27_06730 [Spirosoma montaniterrae]
MVTKNQRLIGILLTVAFLLSVPFFAMQLTDEVNWTLSDFIIAGTLLLGTGLTGELILRKVNKTTHRIALCAMLLAALFLVWVELAVGLFGSPFAGS